MERYRVVMSTARRDDVIDLHFQSTKTFALVLSTVLPDALQRHGEVWVVTGTGHHVGTKTHQKGGGALESAVLAWLLDEGYQVFRGKDRNGEGGAMLVKE
jgi:Smr domain